jgi:hypothetical protein
MQIYRTLCFCFHGNHGHYTTNDYFVICFRQVSIQQIKTSIMHLAPCSQEIIDNENPILFTFFLGRCEMRCSVAMVTIIVFFPSQPWTLFKLTLLSVYNLTFSYEISNMEIFVNKRKFYDFSMI